MKAKVILQEKFKLEALRRNFNNNYQPNAEKFKLAAENFVMCTNKFIKDKVAGKQKEK